MSTLRSRAIAATAAVSASLLLGACGTNFSAQTNQQYQAAEGANARGEVDSMNTVVVASEDGAAVISAGLVNKTDAEQTLTKVTITTADGTSLTVEPAADVTIAAGDIVTLGSAATNAFVVPDGAEAGAYVAITFTFSDAEPTEVDAPVVERSETYESVVEPS